jgi:hypothetical protein
MAVFQRNAVLALTRRIARDPRHTDVRVVGEGGRPEREHAGWTMGYLHDVGVEDDLETLLMIPQRRASSSPTSSSGCAPIR